jgi:hypothetical protein
VTAQEQIAKLESLLERIRRNAAAPRPVVVRAAVAPVAVPVAEPVVAAEEVSLESLGATEARPAAEPLRERVQSADMEELEVVEIGDVVELGAEESAATDVSALEEPVPESAPRAAVQSVEVEIEPPVKTPPPESGRQAVTPPPVVAESRAASEDDDFAEDDLLEPDLSGTPISIVNPGAPTMAQLGDTVKLDGDAAPSASLELAQSEARAPHGPGDELEADLPKRGRAAGAYDAALAPPSTATSDLERHREVKPESGDVPSRRVDPLAATVPDLRTALALAKTLPDARSPFADAIRATTEAVAEPPKAEAKLERAESKAVATAPELVVERPAVSAPHTAEVVVDKPRRVPETFIELLDASLGLEA